MANLSVAVAEPSVLSQIAFGLIFMVVVFIACAVIMVFISFILPRSSDERGVENDEASPEEEIVPRGGSPAVSVDDDAEGHTAAVG